MSYASPEEMSSELADTRLIPLRQGTQVVVYPKKESVQAEVEFTRPSIIIVGSPSTKDGQRYEAARKEVLQRTPAGIILLPHQILQGLVYRRLQRMREELGLDSDAYDPFSELFDFEMGKPLEVPEEKLEGDDFLLPDSSFLFPPSTPFPSYNPIPQFPMPPLPIYYPKSKNLEEILKDYNIIIPESKYKENEYIDLKINKNEIINDNKKYFSSKPEYEDTFLKDNIISYFTKEISDTLVSKYSRIISEGIDKGKRKKLENYLSLIDTELDAIRVLIARGVGRK